MVRTKLTISIGIAAALSASVLVGATATAQAPNRDTAGPAPLDQPVAFRPINAITGAATDNHIIDPGTLHWNGNLRKVRGMVTELTMDWNAAGLPDTLQSMWNSDEYVIPGQAGRAKIRAGTFLLCDEIGSWAGPFGGVEYVDGATDLQATMMGASGYAGQCAILNVIHSPQMGWEMDGLIFDCRSLQTME
jgi:hypothetical protein